MNSIHSLDVVIGMVMVFLAVSLVCSSVNEVLAAAFELRASTLEGALESLLGSNLAKQVLEQPLVPSAVNNAHNKRTPPYIDPALFATALLDCIVPPPAANAAAPAVAPPPSQSDAAETPQTTSAPSQPASVPSQQFVDAHDAITQLSASPMKRSLVAFLREAHGDYTKLQTQIANWYDAYMDRIGGAYKRRSQWIISIIAIAVVASLNVDTLKIYKQLTTQPVFAAALADKAKGLISSPAPNATVPPDIGSAVDAVNAKIAAFPVPIGWHHDDSPSLNPWWRKVIGLFITALAASLGAPFWFDTLSKLANLRSAGAKPNGN